MMIKNQRSLQLFHIFIVVLILLCMKSATIDLEPGILKDANMSIMCINRERHALLIFKAGLLDDYDRLSSWGSEEDKKDCCKWRGVLCSNRTGHVITLNLAAPYFSKFSMYYSLRGKISPSLLELRHLKYLDLSYNDFGYIPIPEFIGSLAKLKYLDLSCAGFGGTIPSQLGNLSKLYHLDLGFNGLNVTTENLDWLAHLSSLTHLDMSRVDLSRATHWVDIIVSLPFLSYLDLHGCRLSRVMSPSPSSSNSSTSIVTLDLSYNNFTSSIYRWLFNLSSRSLVNIDLTGNQIEGPLPGALGNMISLVHLDLHGNQFEGVIPKSFGNLCKLQVLDLSFNKLSGEISDFLKNLSCAEVSLESLVLTGNKLTGSLTDITRFSSLKELSLGDNQLNGILLKSFGQLPKLEVLNVSSNSLQGVISDVHFLNLTRLKVLDLSLNSFFLELSSQWVSPFQLDTINLRSCNLGPRFPKWLQTQRKFSLLDLSGSGISDTIPMWFWNQSTRLKVLDLSSNKFRGRLPDLSSKFVHYPIIDLSSNYFVGPVPRLPSSLTSLNLSQNKFSGRLSFLCEITNQTLTFLDLSYNLLSGELGGCLEQFRELVILKLAHNKLSGKIPSYVESLFQLETLVLRNNSFFGELPLSLRNCTSLNFMDLGENKLSGNIPAVIGENLLKLKVLILRSNKFQGSIPLHLCYLTKLQLLDLSRNSISGTIPRCFNNLTAMVQREISFEYSFITVLVTLTFNGREIELLDSFTVVDLSSNNLTGELPETITSLQGLRILNLSINQLYGIIPPMIGQMEVLDLSRNGLSGRIPESMSEMPFLSYLNLSYNNLSGRIPTGGQLNTFQNDSYIENGVLCGFPLSVDCLGDVDLSTIEEDEDEDEDEFVRWFYMGMALGFSTGFLGICATLLFNSRWRNGYFLFLHTTKNWLFVHVPYFARARC